ncbi:hypothetical protein CU044_2631 [Streptomyces sp. L-9-10]|nr:hypothetical protein CU044_2631 [Streptomyces sp. L-9-10]
MRHIAILPSRRPPGQRGPRVRSAPSGPWTRTGRVTRISCSGGTLDTRPYVLLPAT